MLNTVYGKPWEKVSPILFTLTSRSDSDFERSNISLKENKPDGVNPNSNDIEYYVRKNEGKISMVFGRLNTHKPEKSWSHPSDYNVRSSQT